MTNLDGSAADQLEELQAKFEDTDGFRAVVYSGDSAAIVVAPETLEDWRKTLVNSDLKVVASCVSTALLDATRGAVDSTSVGADGFSSVGYDALHDAVAAISTAPIDYLVAKVEASVPGAVDAALADGTLRISEANPGDFSAASRGADTAPFWGGAQIATGLSCSTGFYLNSSTYGTVMLSAGHCYSGNGVSTQNGNHTAVVGTSEGWSIDPDTALIDGQSYYRKSYSWNDQTSSKLISEASNPTTGVAYCNLGAVSLRVCSAYSALDVDATYEGYTRHHLAYTEQAKGPGIPPLAVAGDSGAGVFRELSGGVLGARGDVVANGATSTVWARWDTKLQTILAQYSATVVISG